MKNAKQLVLCGGVAANSRLRERLTSDFEGLAKVALTPMSYCTDNAAMIATAAFFQYENEKGFNSFQLEPQANIALA